jgi:hypothetical protein
LNIMPDAFESRFQNLHEFVTQARINLDRNNWDYLIGGSETETTLARNRLALDSIGFGRGYCATCRTSIAAGHCSGKSCASRFCARRLARSKSSSRAAGPPLPQQRVNSATA